MATEFGKEGFSAVATFFGKDGASGEGALSANAKSSGDGDEARKLTQKQGNRLGLSTSSSKEKSGGLSGGLADAKKQLLGVGRKKRRHEDDEGSGSEADDGGDSDDKEEVGGPAPLFPVTLARPPPRRYLLPRPLAGLSILPVAVVRLPRRG